MGVHNLERIFRPQRIAVMGASDRPESVAGTVLRNLIASGFAGAVYPVNPKHEAVHGIQAFRDVRELPHTPDLAVLCTPAPTIPDLVRQCGEQDIQGVMILSAGFRETGGDGIALESQIRREARRFPAMRILGPNCLGAIVPGQRLNASFAAGMPKAGRVGFISQSGALCTSVLDWALRADVGFSCFVSIGNMVDITFGDLIDYLSADTQTESIILYVESITDPREFISAARAFTRARPIVVYKAGRFTESAHAAASHTGAMAGEDLVYEAAFQRAGIVRVYGMDEMFACAELLARHRGPEGSRLAIVTNAGGLAVMATDVLMASEGTLAELTTKTMQKLNDALPSSWSHGNPVDVLGDAPTERMTAALRLVLADPGVDAVLVILAPQAMTDATAAATAVAEVARFCRKVILAAWVGGRDMEHGRACLEHAGVPTYATPESAVQALMHLVAYRRNLEILYETPREILTGSAPEGTSASDVVDEVRREGRRLLSEKETKDVLSAYGMPVNDTVIAGTADEAARAAATLGYPVVLKVLSPAITHKTDIGGVALNLHEESQVRETFDAIVRRARHRHPQARVDGVTVQQMVTVPHSVELILGAKKDPTFGTAIMVGMGGVAAELYADRAVGLPPLNERLARRMLESLRAWRLLQGYRGRPGIDVEHLVEQLIRFSYLVASHPEFAQIDVNPLLATPQGVIALGGRIMLDVSTGERAVRPFEHLAIRPYPQQYTRSITLDDGVPLVLRPIRPEDEPLWHEMLARCSTESLRYRFRSIFKRSTHKMAARYCFVDYDREMNIVAETKGRGNRQLVGMCGLVADADHETAEYAVLVADDWQRRGLGSALTAYSLEVAREWGVQHIVAETIRANRKMVSIFKSHGFELAPSDPEGGIFCRKAIDTPAPAPATEQA